MTDIPEHIKALIEKHLSGNDSPADSAVFQERSNLHADQEDEFTQLTQLWNASGIALDTPQFDASKAWHSMERRLASAGSNAPGPTTLPDSAGHAAKRTGLFARIPHPAKRAFAAAAIGAAVLVAGGIITKRLSMAAGWQSVVAERDNRKTTLPDGSTVLLRKGATLQYPAAFDAPERRVTITGEAFFDIHPEKGRPFVVATARSLIEVLGTSFLVKASASSDRVIVQTGRILVTDKAASGQHCILSEKQQAILSEKGLEQNTVSAANYLSWQTDDLQFKETPLDQVAEDLSDHYGIVIRLAATLIPKSDLYKISAEFSHQPLEQSLEEITRLTGLLYRRNGDTIIIYQPQ